MFLNLGELSNNFTSWTNSTFSSTSIYFQPIWISSFLFSIIIFTVAGNSLVCIAVLRERNLRNTTNYFLTSLAVTDCLVACLVMPIAASVDLIGHFPFDSLACIIWSTFDVCCCTSSIWHMSVMSLDRYLTLRYPLKYGRHKRLSLMAYKIVTIWFISFAICFPLFILGLLNSSNVYNEETRACFPNNRTFKIYGSSVAFFIPLIIMVVTYALTMSALQQAHTTKIERYRRRKRIHAVVNLATMAIRWKRAVNTVEIPDQNVLATQTKELRDDENKEISENSKTFPTTNEHNRKEKSFQTLSKCLNEGSSYSNSDLHLLPSQQSSPTKRSHSFTPLVPSDHNRKITQSHSSARALLQIRRHSAKISEELANLSTKLYGTKNKSCLNSPRMSLIVPNASSLIDGQTPTINDLIACQRVPIRRISYSIELNQNQITNKNDTNTPISNVQEKRLLSNHRFSCTPTMDGQGQRLKACLNTKSSMRSTSAMHFTENKPIVIVYEAHVPSSSTLKRNYPHLQDLIGQTVTTTSKPDEKNTSRTTKNLFIENSIVNLALPHRSISSIAFSMMKNRRSPSTRHSNASSIASAVQVGLKKLNSHQRERMSQASFQMVSLDTDDSSSCSSSLTQRSTTRPSAPSVSMPAKRWKKIRKISKQSGNNERKAMRVLLIIFSIFVILWTPFFIINLLSCFMDQISPILISVATWLGYCSSCANPIIYTIFSRSFRRAFINILTCRKVIRSHRYQPATRYSLPGSARSRILSLNKETLE